MMIDFRNFDNLQELTDYFCDELTCTQAVIESRWGDGDVVCPYCGGHHCPRRKDGRFYCKECNKTFSCKVGTIFEGTNLPLRKWFIAMYMISSHKKGISSHQLSRDIKVTQKTAWYILHKVRCLFAQSDSDVLSGDVELDEVYIGGKEKWKHKSMRTAKTQGRSTKTKTPVFGLMERSTITNAKGEDEFMSYVHAFKVEKTDGKTLLPIVEQFVQEGSHVITDELTSYSKLNTLGFIHDVVNHGSDEFVRGNLFTNNMEGFWSHFRRMIIGCYHNISDEHLQSYIDEACYRWNTRKMSESARFAHMFSMCIGIVRTNDTFVLCNKVA